MKLSSITSAVNGFFLATLTASALYAESNNKTVAERFPEIRMAAEQGDAEAQHKLGELYCKGIYVEQDHSKAFEWSLKAAKQDVPEAQTHVGQMYFNGLGVTQNNAKASEWYLKAAKQGYPGAQYELSRLYDKTSNGSDTKLALAVSWCRKAAEQGLPEAQYALGQFLDQGEGTPVDHAESFKWVKKAAENGHVQAQGFLGSMYGDGLGTSVDYEKAVKWWESAARQGSSPALVFLGEVYERGQGVPRNATKAYDWYRKAAERGDTEAKYKLGRIYATGRGATRDVDKARDWLQQAANEGSADARELLSSWKPARSKGATSAFTEMVHLKRNAMISLRHSTASGYGVFVSKDGLALVHMYPLCSKETPHVTLEDGSLLEFGYVLGILPKHEFALVKFDHAPESWLEICNEEPELDETIALLPINRLDPWAHIVSTPALVGPVMAKNSLPTANTKRQDFIRVLSLGVPLTGEQRRELGPGCVAINKKGELVGFMAGKKETGGPKMATQTLIYLSGVAPLKQKVNAFVIAAKRVDFPIPEKQNPMSVASLDPNFHLLNVAMEQRNLREYERLVNLLYEKYPKDRAVHSRRMVLTDPSLKGQLSKEYDPATIMGDFADLSGQTPAEQAQILMREIPPLAKQRKWDDAISKCKKAIELTPPDYPDYQISLISLLMMSGQVDEAEKLARKIYEFSPDDFGLVTLFGNILAQQKKKDELIQLMKRERELINIYKGE